MHQDAIFFKLRDLNSRIKSICKVVLNEPGKELSKSLIEKLFRQKQIPVSEKIIQFIYQNIKKKIQ